MYSMGEFIQLLWPRNMNTHRVLLALALVSAMASSVFVISSTALTASSSVKLTDKTSIRAAVIHASTDVEEANLIRIADEAAKAVRNIQSARVSIFNGQPDDATTLIEVARNELLAAKESLTELSLMSEQTNELGNYHIQFHASVSLIGDALPDHKTESAALEKAKEHLAIGKNKEALAELKVANIGVSVDTARLPMAKSLKHVEDAIMLIKDVKYYEANLALKAIEDSVIVKSFVINTSRELDHSEKLKSKSATLHQSIMLPM